MKKSGKDKSGKSRKKKTKTWRVRVDEDLDANARKYAKESGFSLGAILRAITKNWFNPEDPRPLPPGIEEEKKRPARKKKKKK